MFGLMAGLHARAGHVKSRPGGCCRYERANGVTIAWYTHDATAAVWPLAADDASSSLASRAADAITKQQRNIETFMRTCLRELVQVDAD
jgi:hypothetical protein